MIKLMAMVSIAILMVLSMKVNGKKINNMDLVLRHGQMVQNTTVNMFRERSMEKEHSHGLTDQHTMVSSWKTISKEMVNTIGLMVENTMDPGLITKWKVKVCSHGQMEGGMKENM